MDSRYFKRQTSYSSVNQSEHNERSCIDTQANSPSGKPPNSSGLKSHRWGFKVTNKTTNSKTEHMNRILEILHEEITRSNMLHNEFLQHQALSLQILSDDTKKSYPSENTTISEKVLINKRQMEEFGTGSIPLFQVA